jgi:hypothetical protein
MELSIQTRLPLPPWNTVQPFDSVPPAQQGGTPTLHDLKAEVLRQLNDAGLSPGFYDANNIRLEINGQNPDGATPLNSFKAGTRVW